MKIVVESAIGIGEPVEVKADAKKTVRQVLEEVASQNLVDPNSISLVHDGRVLDVGKTLKQAGISDGAVLKTLPKNPKGGSGASLAVSPQLKRRLHSELRRVREARLPLSPKAPLEWHGILHAAGRWSGQQWRFKIAVPLDYPAKPPLVTFLDRPVPAHPNISPGGFVCLNHLVESWSPTMNLATVYDDLRWLTKNPNYHHPNNPHARPPILSLPKRNAWDRLAAWLA